MVCFRVDGNAQIGTGHVMRCLSIADELKRKGIASLFIMSSDSDKFREEVSKHGHESIIIDSDFSKKETDSLILVANKCIPSMVIVDSYQVNDHYMDDLYKLLGGNGIKLVYIDDRYEFPYSCDLLINYNIYADFRKYRELYGNKAMPQVILGPEYAPLRKEFMNLKKREIKSQATSVFVSTGGADTEHFTMDLIRSASGSRLNYTFVIGPMNEDREKIHKTASDNDNITIKENVRNISELMISSDIAISAAGFTLYELCAAQTPAITYVLADNQISAAKTFAKNGIMINCGDIRKSEKRTIANMLVRKAELLADDYAERKRMACIMSRVADGKGAKHLAEELIKMNREVYRDEII